MIKYHIVAAVRGGQNRPDVSIVHVGTDERRALEKAAEVTDDKADEVHVFENAKPSRILTPKPLYPKGSEAKSSATKKAAKKAAKKSEGSGDPMA